MSVCPFSLMVYHTKVYFKLFSWSGKNKFNRLQRPYNTIFVFTWTSKSLFPKNCHFRVQVRKILTQSWELFPFSVTHFSFKLAMTKELVPLTSTSLLASFSFKLILVFGILFSSALSPFSVYRNGKKRFMASARLFDAALVSDERSPKWI